jgi:hypothetical protein
MLLLFLLTARTTFAGWELTPPADPNRNWNTSVTAAGQYDDNFNATQKNRQSGFRLNSDIKLRATVPLERFLMGVQYDYGVVYPRDVKLGGVNETHNVNASANYTVSPQLMLGLSETFINSLQPQLVQTPANAPATIVQAGTYVYNNLGGNLSYALTPRWTLSLNGSWDFLRYQVSSIASNNDHDDYSATISALYALDPRTSVGINYQYAQSVFINPGLHSGLNASSDTAYLSLSRRFNPQLSATVNGGYTIRKSEDGTVSTSPSAYGSLVYNYGPASTLSLTIAESLSSASLGVTRQFSAQENTSFALQANHRLTTRLHAVADLTYVDSTFTAPLSSTVTVKPTEQALTGHLGLSYAFREWLSANLDYYYFQLTVSKATIIVPPGVPVQVVQPYDRNQVSMGMTLTY